MSLLERYVFRACTTVWRHAYDKSGTNMPRAVKITGPCHECKKEISVEVEPTDLERFRAGDFVQDCFPYLSPAEREFLISGICSVCWDEMFPEVEDDDEDDREGHGNL